MAIGVAQRPRNPEATAPYQVVAGEQVKNGMIQEVHAVLFNLLDEIPSVWEAEYVLDAAVGKSSVDPDNVGLVGRVRLARTACDDAAIGDDRSCRRACASPRLMHESFLHQFAGARIDGKDLASTACLI